LRERDETELVESLMEYDGEDEQKHWFAAAVSVALDRSSSGKGVFSQELASKLQVSDEPFNIPEYIKNAIDHTLRNARNT
jgi:hypothetical protein